MSASLVGSEMCIRDSSDTPSTRHATRQTDAHQTLSSASNILIIANGCWTVSYTHLTLPTICSV
eukprot:14923338-Alexandrium_andersonii.AAC.1